MKIKIEIKHWIYTKKNVKAVRGTEKLFFQGNNMNDFINRLLLSIIVQLAVGKFIPFNILNWEWWVTTLPLSVVIVIYFTFERGGRKEDMDDYFEDIKKKDDEKPEQSCHCGCGCGQECGVEGH